MAVGELPPEQGQPEEPDEFGMVPPQQEPEQKNPDLNLDALDSIQELEFKPPELGRISDDYTHLYENYTEKRMDPGDFTFPIIDQSFLLDAMRRHNENMKNIRKARLFNKYLSEPGYYGSISPNSRPPKPQSEPVEKRDPYPSRAGWREEFLPPFDASAEEPKDKPKGKIGDYEIIESATTFEDIGGNAHAKDLLTEIGQQFESPEDYEKWDVPVPKGVLLYGEPGTGKTMLAKAFANKAKAAFVEVPVASLRDKYYGESEKNLKGLFDEAAKYKGQVVLFFDEIDSLLPDRKNVIANSPDSQLVNTFLQAMDGMRSAKNVMVLGATNYKDRLDPAATRPGRFDHKVPVELPDRAGAREIVAKQLLSGERKAKRAITEDALNIDEICGVLTGLSGADIAEVVNRVKRTMAQTERAMRSDKGLPEGMTFDEQDRDQLLITTDDVVAAAINYQLRK